MQSAQDKERSGNGTRRHWPGDNNGTALFHSLAQSPGAPSIGTLSGAVSVAHSEGDGTDKGMDVLDKQARKFLTPVLSRLEKVSAQYAHMYSLPETLQQRFSKNEWLIISGPENLFGKLMMYPQS